MSKYDGLGTHLRRQKGSEVPMTFSEIEDATGTKLPPKAQHSRAWWSNNPSNNVMTKIWLDAGFETAQVDIPGRKLVFKRVRRSPLLGAMKGTFSVDPSWDLTKPAMSDEEIAETEANVHRTADLIDAGRTGMSETAQEYKPADAVEKKLGRHPLIGAMKGTFTIEPGWDLTKPALDPDELAEMFANIERTADLIEAGLASKKR